MRVPPLGAIYSCLDKTKTFERKSNRLEYRRPHTLAVHKKPPAVALHHASAAPFGNAAACHFGDSENDLAMLEAVGLGVAMGNAPLAIQQKAAAVTATNDEDGVALALEKYVLGR